MERRVSLGGHMRSHMMNIYAAKIASKGENSQSVHSRSSESSFPSDHEEEEEIGGVKDLFNYKLSTKTEYKKNPVCRRSKRVRKSRISDLTMNGFFEVKKSSFSIESPISDTTSDEDVAHCLIMLSRDNCTRVEMEFQEEEEKFEDDDSDSGLEKVKKNKVNGKYRCETCNKLFRSYQALGGHRANHKRIKLEAPAAAEAAAPLPTVAEVVEEKIHECPFCRRVFSSGQALGGHKRSHFMNGGAISKNVGTISPVKQISIIGPTFDIDLNLPAPVDEDDEIR